MRRFMINTGTGIGTALIAAAGFAAPAQANPIDPSFLSDLAGAGISVGDPAAATELGKSVCPMLTEPVGTAASVAAPITGLNGGPAMSPDLARMFAEFAVNAYCPHMMSELATGHVPEMPQIMGMALPVPSLH